MGQAASDGCCDSSKTPPKLQPEAEQITQLSFQPQDPPPNAHKVPDVAPDPDFTPDATHARSALSGLALMTKDLTKSDRQFLRGVPMHQTLWRAGRMWRRRPAALSLDERSKLHFCSRPTEGLDKFLSHTWLTSGKRKFLSLLVRNGWPCMLQAWTLTILISFLLCILDVLPLTFETEGSAIGFEGTIVIGCWLSLFGMAASVGGLLISPYLSCKKAEMCFLDVVCINQTDEAVMQEGINNLGAFLEASEELHVLWDTPLFSRLWCVFELAAFSKLNPAGKITIAPIFVEGVACWLFFGMQCISWLAFLVRTRLSNQGFLESMVAILVILMAPLLHSLRRDLRYGEELMRVLATFDVKDVNCSKDADKANIHAAIIRWYGSLEAFSEFVSGPFRQKVRDLTRTPGRMPMGYFFIISLPTHAYALDVFVGLWKAGVSVEALMAWFIGGQIGFALLWFPAVLVMAVFACEHWAHRRSNFCKDCLLTFAICAVVWSAFGFGAFASSFASLSSILVALLWTAVAALFAGFTWYFCWLR